MMPSDAARVRAAIPLLAALLLLGSCDRFRREPLVLPTATEAEAFYEAHGDTRDVGLNGNVVEVSVRQSGRQLRRGGVLWAKVGPYVYLLTPATRDLFREYSGVAAVRVTTIAPDGRSVARAMLRRDELNDLLWRRTLNILGHALREGTARPTRLEDLVRWGEDHTEYWYNPAYVPE